MEGSHSNVDYSIVQITNRDGDRIIDFLRQFFFRDEPLNVAVGLLDESETCPELEEYCISSIPDGVSLMAISPTGKILGVCLNGIMRREDSMNDSNDNSKDCPNPKFKKILDLLTTVGRESDIFKQFPDVDKVIDIRIVSVDDSCRGQGIAKALLDKTKVLAKDLGYPMVRVDCTSHFSAKAVARLGFQCVYTLPYSEHLSKDGEPVFTPEPPHTCVKTYVHLIAN